MRTQASSRYDLTFSQDSSWTKCLKDDPSNDLDLLDGMPPKIWSSGVYSVPESTDTPNTGDSSDDARENICAMTPASSWHMSTASSQCPAIATVPGGVHGSSGPDSPYQQQPEVIKYSGIHPLEEQASIQGDTVKRSFHQDRSTAVLCGHRIDVLKFCGECAEELATFFVPAQDYSRENFAEEDDSTMDQDQAIWTQNTLSN